MFRKANPTQKRESPYRNLNNDNPTNKAATSFQPTKTPELKDLAKTLLSKKTQQKEKNKKKPPIEVKVPKN